MILKIDYNSDKPIYLQLKEQIVEGIASGSLKPGDSLPSVRQMAEDIGINLHTVNKAYSILQNEGFLSIYERKSAVINASFEKNDKLFLNNLSQLVRPIIAEAYCKGINESDFLEKCKELFLLFKKGRINEI